MIDFYDRVRKSFITPSAVPDMDDSVSTYDDSKSESESELESEFD